MRYRHIINLLWVSVPVCVLLRAIQLFFTIDKTTGFVKQQYSQISLLITFVVCAAVAAVSVMVFSIEKIKAEKKEAQPLTAFASVLLGGMFFYDTVTTLSSLNTFEIKTILMIALGIFSSVIFAAYGIKCIYKYQFLNWLLAVPVIYYVVKLINLFVNTSSLAMVTENIFMLFANSAVLWFVFEFASFENKINTSEKKQKSMFAIAVAAIMLGTVSALPRLILAILQKIEITKGDVSASLLILAQIVFILAYMHSNFGKVKSTKQPLISKHSA